MRSLRRRSRVGAQRESIAAFQLDSGPIGFIAKLDDSHPRHRGLHAQCRAELLGLAAVERTCQFRARIAEFDPLGLRFPGRFLVVRKMGPILLPPFFFPGIAQVLLPNLDGLVKIACELTIKLIPRIRSATGAEIVAAGPLPHRPARRASKDLRRRCWSPGHRFRLRKAERTRIRICRIGILIQPRRGFCRHSSPKR